MNVDWYTKTMLTLIAACLVWLCVNGATPVASAQTAQAPPPPTPVILVNERGVPLITPEGLRVNFGAPPIRVTVSNQTLPVTLSQTVPVALTSIERGRLWQPITVDVLKPPPTSMPTP